MFDDEEDALFNQPKQFSLDINDYIAMANKLVDDFIRFICNIITNEKIVFILKNKFHLIGDSTDSSVIADLVSKKFEENYTKKDVDDAIIFVFEEVEKEKLGKKAKTMFTFMKGLMQYCNKHKGELNG